MKTIRQTKERGGQDDRAEIEQRHNEVANGTGQPDVDVHIEVDIHIDITDVHVELADICVEINAAEDHGYHEGAAKQCGRYVQPNHL